MEGVLISLSTPKKIAKGLTNIPKSGYKNCFEDWANPEDTCKSAAACICVALADAGMCVDLAWVCLCVLLQLGPVCGILHLGPTLKTTNLILIN